jgi:MFS family permease
LTKLNHSPRLGFVTEETRPLDKPRRGGLWHHLDFRRLWIGETVSQFGTQVSQIALPLVAILVVHASTFEVGALAACESLAFLVIGLPAGAWVDRMRFRQVLIINDVVRAAAIGSIPAAAAMHVLTIGQLYVVALVISVCTVFFDVAYQSYLPQLVDRELIVEGNAKLQGSESVAQVAGPSIGGLLIQALTAPYAILVDAISFLWSAAWVAKIQTTVVKPERKPDRHLGREIAEGLKFGCCVRSRCAQARRICSTAPLSPCSSCCWRVIYTCRPERSA